MRHRDEARWEGVALVSKDVGTRNKPARWRIGGVQYATEGEAMLAQLLIAMGIPFTPNVSFQVEFPRRSGKKREFVPDFVFDRQAFVWCGPHGETLIHGIEAKGAGNTPGSRRPARKAMARARFKIRLLQEQRSIVIKLLTDAEIKRFFEKGKLPLRPFTPK